jgi:flagellin-like hook-associated protein FlgL
MTISTRLFNEQTVRQIGLLNDRVQGLQDQVATGRADTRPSQDLMSAVKLSASKELLGGIERYQTNIDVALLRLDLADSTLAQIGNVATRLSELSVQAATDTLSYADRQSVRLEVEQQLELLLGLANTRDSQGQSLFAGYRTADVPFVRDASGSVVYQGDSGVHTLRISDSQSLPTSLDGASAFQRIETETGPKSLCAIVEDFIGALETSDTPEGRAGLGQAVSEMTAMTSHVAAQRTRVGANARTAEIQSEALGKRELLVRKAISGLEDADLAEVISQLQSLLVNRDATQQVFAKISQQSLFDFIR